VLRAPRWLCAGVAADDVPERDIVAERNGCGRIPVRADPGGRRRARPLLQAQVALANGDYDVATAEYGGAVAADPSSAFLRTRLASLYVRDGRLSDALRQLDEAITLEPDAVQARVLLAASCRRPVEDDAAMAQYRAVLELEPTNQEALLFLADYTPVAAITITRRRSCCGSPRRSARLPRLLLSGPRVRGPARFSTRRGGLREGASSSARLGGRTARSGPLYEAQDQPDRAIANYQRVLRTNPQNALARKRLGSLYVVRNA